MSASDVLKYIELIRELRFIDKFRSLILKTMRGLKPTLGMYWDKKGNAYCPIDHSLLSNYGQKRKDPILYAFRCQKCNKLYYLKDKNNKGITLAEAQELVKKLWE